MGWPVTGWMENCAKNFVAAANGTKGGQVCQDIFWLRECEFSWLGRRYSYPGSSTVQWLSRRKACPVWSALALKYIIMMHMRKRIRVKIGYSKTGKFLIRYNRPLSCRVFEKFFPLWKLWKFYTVRKTICRVFGNFLYENYGRSDSCIETMQRRWFWDIPLVMIIHESGYSTIEIKIERGSGAVTGSENVIE